MSPKPAARSVLDRVPIVRLVREAANNFDPSEARAPSAPEAEASLLGALLIDNEAFDRVAGLVSADDFYLDAHRRIWRHIAREIKAGRPADVVTVSESIEASEDKDKTGGAAYLAALAQNTPSALNIRRYADLVRDRAQRRNVVALGGELQERAPHGDLRELLRDAAAQLAAVNAPGAGLSVLDLADLARRQPERPRFIIPDWLPCGYVSLLAGHGGVGKSALALHISVCMASGLPFFGLQVAHRRVLYLSCEDREDVLHWRLARICAHHGIDLAGLRGALEVVDLVGRDALLWERDPRTGNTITPAFGLLQEAVRRHRTQVLVLDGIADTFGGNENSRSEVKRFINTLVALVPPDGAVLLIGHIAKPATAVAATSEAYSGTTGWHNSVRARWYLYPETEQGEDGGRPERTGDLILDLQKSNLGRSDQQMRFRWDDAAHLFIGERIGASAFDRKHQDRTEQDGIRRALKGCMDARLYVPAAKQGSSTAYQTLSLRPEFPASLKGGGRPKTRRFGRQIEALRQLRHIEEGRYRRKNRHDVATLALTTEGCAACA